MLQTKVAIKENAQNWITRNSEKKLSEIFNMEPMWYTRDRIESLELLSSRTYHALARILHSPLFSPDYVHLTLDEVLELTVEQLWKARNLSVRGFAEILLSIYKQANIEKVCDFDSIIEMGRALGIDCKFNY